ncbi:PREDICTED: tubulin polyglutamylase TTLL4-like [Polistes canadensis]|uniref:tubulin polyglutamylase TTLL4-like n=1 Tax=Polistes canadensis TaxID=91411 RepID=UPI0007190217|nr:PREDICTED: tubulin polyglutamylase TTLL4-like [Polistes canadensis]
MRIRKKKKKKDVSTGTSHGKLWWNDEFENDEGFEYDEVTERLLTLTMTRRIHTTRTKLLTIDGDRRSIETDQVDKKKSKLPMRDSLFANVPPYIIFHLYDKNGASLPEEITRHLLWWHTKNFSPRMIRLTVLKSGFTMTDKSMADWSGTWCNNLTYLRTANKLKRYQKINHFTNCRELTNKINLWNNFNRMAKKYGKKSYDYMPQSYILPKDNNKLKRFMDRKSACTTWILKPGDCCAGHGIRLVSRYYEIPKRSSYLAQRYLCNPSLIDGYKYDLRLYVLLTSIDPLRMFLYTEGLVRVATVKYQNKIDNLYDRFMHLTNTSINKLNPTFRGNDDPNKQQGNIWSLTALWDYLRLKERADINLIWEKIKCIVIKSIISAEHSLITGTKKFNNLSNYNNCQLFGFDILLDVHLEPWLLEINDCPSMETETTLCGIVKGQLVCDFLNLIGFHVPDILTANDLNNIKDISNETLSCYNRYIYDNALSDIGKTKKHLFEDDNNDRSNYLNVILKMLTPDDVKVLIRHEDELSQTGKFEKIFPTCNTYEYFKYFDNVSYYNMLLDAWEHTYGNDRLQGIDRLRKLCEKKYHLIQGSLKNIQELMNT